ncbi:hypothetical protein [Streptomyces sp. NPDC003327]
MTHAVRGRWIGVLLLSAALTAGSAGCGEAAQEAPPASPSPSTSRTGPVPTPTAASPSGTATPTPPATATDAPRSEDVLVEVTVTGGFAGVRNTLVVRHDGTWTLSSPGRPDRKTGRVAPAGTAALRAALEDPAFARVPDRPADEPVRDGFQYAVTYGDRLVIARDGSVPPALRRVLDALPEGGPPTSP